MKNSEWFNPKIEYHLENNVRHNKGSTPEIIFLNIFTIFANSHLICKQDLPYCKQ